MKLINGLMISKTLFLKSILPHEPMSINGFNVIVRNFAGLCEKPHMINKACDENLQNRYKTFTLTFT